MLPENLLCDYCSDFFKKALRGPFVEKNGLIELPEDDAQDFSNFIRAVYSHTLGNDYEKLLSGLSFTELIGVYLLAYKYMNVYFQDFSIGVVYDRLELDEWYGHDAYDAIANVFAKTHQSSKMRLLLIRWFGWNYLECAFREEMMPEPCRAIIESGHGEVTSALLMEIYGWFRNEDEALPKTEFREVVGTKSEFSNGPSST